MKIPPFASANGGIFFILLSLSLVEAQTIEEPLTPIVLTIDGRDALIIPGRIEIALMESSFADFDREAILRGELGTGLASLDTLNQQEQVVAIVPLSISPSKPYCGFFGRV